MIFEEIMNVHETFKYHIRIMIFEEFMYGHEYS
jgi:hypothetical protein